MHQLNVSMLGPSGVGKTTLLAAMYEQFNATVGKNNLLLRPVDDAATILQSRLADLKAVANEFVVRGGLAPDRKPRDYRFSLGKKASKPSADLSFWDYPGEYHSSGNGDEKQVLSRVANAAAVVLAIDTPALVEQSGRWNDLMNRPQQITNVFQAAYEEVRDPRLVILAPVKCERYVSTPADARRIAQLVRERYRILIEFLGCDALRRNVAVVTCPVQTVGSVLFSRIEMDGEYPKFFFRKRKLDAVYSPIDSEQPLRYLLRFLVKLHVDKRNEGFIGWLRDVFDIDEPLKQAVQQFAAGCKVGDGFDVIQSNGYIG